MIRLLNNKAAVAEDMVGTAAAAASVADGHGNMCINSIHKRNGSAQVIVSNIPNHSLQTLLVR